MIPLTYVVRHGQTDWNLEYRLQGQADTDINAEGKRQADRNGRLLAKLIPDPSVFDFVSSPLKRTCETMERIRLAMGLDAGGYRTDPRLMELHFGNWQSFTYDELEARDPGSTAARLFDKWNFRPPGDKAESYAMLLSRLRPWLEEISRPTVCVTHGGTIRCLFRLAGTLSDADAAALDVPQDRILKMEGVKLEWL